MISYKTTKLKRKFYNRNVLSVAKDLLGKILVVKTTRSVLSGKIVEVEAYHGDFDEASHAFRGKTNRNKVMFLEGGHLYVYFTYGAHFCANVVAGKEGKGAAILIRALEPIEGISKMNKNRFSKKLIKDNSLFNLTSGPGKVCKAFGISKTHNGIDLTGDEIFILDHPKLNSKQIGVSRRIGITRSVDLQWRFFINGNPFVSRK